MFAQQTPRTRPLHYSFYDLNALTEIASLGKKVGVDLWNDETPDHRTLKKAIDYLVPCVTPGGKCPFKAEASQTAEGAGA